MNQSQPETMEVNVPVIFVIGGPGSGKGTQCEMIVQKYGFTHLSTGDLLREEVNSGSERGARLTDIMTKGLLVPMEEVLDLLKDSIRKSSGSKGFLIDGYPRELEQAEFFEKEVCRCTLILFFEVPDNVMKERLLERGKTSGRADDNEETIVERLKTFHKYTRPILDHFSERVKRIVAVGTPEEVFSKVREVLDDL